MLVASKYEPPIAPIVARNAVEERARIGSGDVLPEG